MTGIPVFGKKVMSKGRLALQWLRENPTATVRQAAAKFDLNYTYILALMQRNQRLDRRCPICNQPLTQKRDLENVNRYADEYKFYLSKLMDAVRENGSNLTNDEILELVHNSLIHGSASCHSIQSPQD